MTAELHRLSTRPRLRLVEENTAGFVEREMQATELYLDQVAFHLAMVRRGGAGVEAERERATHAAEGMLFHLLMMLGARNADRPLIDTLAARESDRGNGHAR